MYRMLIASVCLWAPLAGTAVADEIIPGPDATAKKLFALVRPINEEMKAAFALHKAGKHREALDAWRDWKVRQFRTVDLGEFGWHSAYLGRTGDAELMVGREPGGKSAWLDIFGINGPPDSIGKINWIAPPPAGWSGGYNTFLGFIPLAAQFHCTGDPIYLRKWFEIAAQFSLYQKAQASGIRDAKSACAHDCTWDPRSAGGVLAQAMRVGNINKTLGAFTKSLADADRRLPWEDVLTARPADLAKGDMAAIPSAELAHIAISLVQDHPDGLLHAYMNANACPNQRQFGLFALLQTARLFPEFARSRELAEQASRGYADYVANMYLTDGGILEQSLNYNDGDIRSVFEVLALNGPDPPPPWLASWVGKAASYRRMSASLLMPVGSRPQQGNGYMVYAPPIWKGGDTAAHWRKTCLQNSGRLPRSHTGTEDPMISQIVERMFGNSAQAPAFTSVCFPHSGYTMMRDGWDAESLHLYGYQGRPARGHKMLAHGSVQVCAYGRMLLVMSGPPTYGFKLPAGIPEDVVPYLNEDSTCKGNTVIVDRKSQSWSGPEAMSARELSEPAVDTWHSSESFDVLGDTYSLGYDGKKITSVGHTRRIVFVKALKLWVVADIMHSRDKKSRNYRQVWNFMPASDKANLAGFREADVTFDAKSQVVSTTEPDAPNVRIHHLGPARVTYHKYHGGKEWHGGKYTDMTPAERKDMPPLGWFSPGIGNPMPAVDIHAEWEGRGDQLLLSVIEPIRRTTSSITTVERAQNGFTLTTDDGTKLTCLAATGAVPMQAAGLEAAARMLLALQPATGDGRGVIMDCSTTHITVAGHVVEAPYPSFEFTRSPAGLASVLPISAPEGFRWITTPQGVEPSYDHIRIQPVSRTFVENELEVSVVGWKPGFRPTIRFTLDPPPHGSGAASGSEPTANSPPYEGPFKIDRTTTVRAVAFPGPRQEAEAVAMRETFTAIRLRTGEAVYLSAVTPASFDTYFSGPVHREFDASGGGLRLGGKEYKKCLFIHPGGAANDKQGVATYSLTGGLSGATRFRAVIGIEDSIPKGPHGSCMFIVEVQRKRKWERIFESAVLKAGGEPQEIRVDITGADQLRLITTDGGDDINSDHALWANARVE